VGTGLPLLKSKVANSMVGSSVFLEFCLAWFWGKGLGEDPVKGTGGVEAVAVLVFFCFVVSFWKYFSYLFWFFFFPPFSFFWQVVPPIFQMDLQRQEGPFSWLGVHLTSLLVSS